MAAVKADFNFAEDLKKLREKTYNWTMAQDAALAKALEGFAAKFEDKLRVADESMAEFGLNLSRAEVRLANAANGLRALSRTQFLEHRVYDEEEPAAPEEGPAVAEPVPKTEAEQQAALVRDCTALVKGGLHFIASFPLSLDAEEDENAAVPVAAVLPGHSFDELELPFVIGTPEFLANDSGGLFEYGERRTLRTTEGTGQADPEEEDGDDEDDADEDENRATGDAGTDEEDEEEEEEEGESDDENDEDWDEETDAEPTPRAPPKPIMRTEKSVAKEKSLLSSMLAAQDDDEDEDEDEDEPTPATYGRDSPGDSDDSDATLPGGPIAKGPPKKAAATAAMSRRPPAARDDDDDESDVAVPVGKGANSKAAPPPPKPPPKPAAPPPPDEEEDEEEDEDDDPFGGGGGFFGGSGGKPPPPEAELALCRGALWRGGHRRRRQAWLQIGLRAHCFRRRRALGPVYKGGLCLSLWRGGRGRGEAGDRRRRAC